LKRSSSGDGDGEVADCLGNEHGGLALCSDSELCLESVVIGYISSDWDKFDSVRKQRGKITVEGLPGFLVKLRAFSQKFKEEDIRATLDELTSDPSNEVDFESFLKIRLLVDLNLKKTPQLIKLADDCDDNVELMELSPEKILLKWMNFHLKKGGYK
ncbi:hypothetical protein Dimus_006089, partial [Dionaea muscipula]